MPNFKPIITKLTKSVDGVSIYQSKNFVDERGSVTSIFEESLQTIFKGINFDNLYTRLLYSTNKRGVVRGIHLASAEVKQTKLVHSIRGSFKDYIFDFRPNSDTYLKYTEVTLDSSKVLVIAPGLGHCFQSLDDNSTLIYLINNKFDLSNEIVVNPTSKEIKINWDYEPILSKKDIMSPLLSEMITDGIFEQFSKGG